MSSLDYSDEAENVLDLFYSVDTLVYVEGVDDVPFWEYMFEKFTTLNVEIQDVGSCTALAPYIEKINNGTLRSIVACDSDLTFFNDSNINHKHIIRTFGYSIENTFIYPQNIHRAIKTVARIPAKDISIEDIKTWLSAFYLNIRKLVKLDIFNYQKRLGKTVMVDNATRFMKSSTSSSICENKINAYIDQIMPELQEYNESYVDKEILSRNLSLTTLVRGHFLFSAIARYVSCFIKSSGRKVSVSNDSLYSILLLSFDRIFDKKHPEYDYYSNALMNIDLTN